MVCILFAFGGLMFKLLDVTQLNRPIFRVGFLGSHTDQNEDPPTNVHKRRIDTNCSESRSIDTLWQGAFS